MSFAQSIYPSNKITSLSKNIDNYHAEYKNVVSIYEDEGGYGDNDINFLNEKLTEDIGGLLLENYKDQRERSENMTKALYSKKELIGDFRLKKFEHKEDNSRALEREHHKRELDQKDKIIKQLEVKNRRLEDAVNNAFNKQKQEV